MKEIYIWWPPRRVTKKKEMFLGLWKITRSPIAPPTRLLHLTGEIALQNERLFFHESQRFISFCRRCWPSSKFCKLPEAHLSLQFGKQCSIIWWRISKQLFPLNFDWPVPWRSCLPTHLQVAGATPKAVLVTASWVVRTAGHYFLWFLLYRSQGISWKKFWKKIWK